MNHLLEKTVNLSHLSFAFNFGVLPLQERCNRSSGTRLEQDGYHQAKIFASLDPARRCRF